MRPLRAVAIFVSSILVVSSLLAGASGIAAASTIVHKPVTLVDTYTGSVKNGTNITIQLNSAPVGDSLYVFLSAETPTPTTKVIPTRISDNVGDELPIMMFAFRPIYDGGIAPTQTQFVGYDLNAIVLSPSFVFIRLNVSTTAIATAVVVADVSRALINTDYPTVAGLDPNSTIWGEPTVADGLACDLTVITAPPLDAVPEFVLIVGTSSTNGTLWTSNNTTVASAVSFAHAPANLVVSDQVVAHNHHAALFNFTILFNEPETYCSNSFFIMGLVDAPAVGFGQQGGLAIGGADWIEYLAVAMILGAVAILGYIGYKDRWFSRRR